MTYLDSTDEELLAHAQQGVAPAFAVLLHRHGPAVLELAAPDDDPIGATVATYVRAMRTLSEADGTNVRGWLLQIAAREIDADVDPATATLPPPATGREGDQPAAHDDDHTEGPEQASTSSPATSSVATTAVLSPRAEELDEVWAELALRWPTGRPPRHVPSWVLWLGTIILLVGLAIALPWAVLGASTTAEPVIEELRASPVLEDLIVEEEEIEEVEEEPLPTFEFPEPPNEETEPEPEPAPEPAPPVEETPPPVETAPAPAPAPVEDPVEEVVVETPADEPADDGAADDELPGDADDGGDDGAPIETPGPEIETPPEPDPIEESADEGSGD